jgi:hypothetical protein
LYSIPKCVVNGEVGELLTKPFQLYNPMGTLYLWGGCKDCKENLRNVKRVIALEIALRSLPRAAIRTSTEGITHVKYLDRKLIIDLPLSLALKPSGQSR